MKSIGPEEFFKLVALNSGVNDLQTVRDVFYGMVRTITRELKAKHVISVPTLGKFVLKIYKARKIRIVNTEVQRNLPAMPLVKFVPEKAVKEYFYELGKEGTVV